MAQTLVSAASTLVSRRFFKWTPRSLACALDHEKSSARSTNPAFTGLFFDICRNAEILGLVTNPMVIGLRLPKRLPRTIQNQIRLARGKTLHGLQQTARTDLGKQQDVHMICHDDKRA